MAKEFKNNLYKDDCKHGVIDQGKDSKIYTKIKQIDREYHVQNNADVAHKDVRIYCDTNQFPTLPFSCSYPKPYGERGLGKNYHLRFDPNLRNVICAIFRIPCDSVACTSML